MRLNAFVCKEVHVTVWNTVWFVLLVKNWIQTR